MAHATSFPKCLLHLSLLDLFMPLSPNSVSPTASLTWNQWREKGEDKEKLRNLKFVWNLFPWTFSHSWTNNVLISQQQENHVLQNSKETHTQNKNRLKTTAQIKIFNEAVQWRHEAFLSTNQLTWTLSVTKHILCTYFIPPSPWGKQSSKWTFLRFHFSNKKTQKTPKHFNSANNNNKIQLLHPNLILFFYDTKPINEALKVPRKIHIILQNIHIQTINKYSSGTSLQVWELERKVELGAQLLPRKSVLSRIQPSLFGISFLGLQYISWDFSAKQSGQLHFHSLEQTTFPSCLCLSKFSGLQIAGPSAFSSYTKATQILIRTLRRNMMDWEQSRTSPNRDFLACYDWWFTGHWTLVLIGQPTHSPQLPKIRGLVLKFIV